MQDASVSYKDFSGDGNVAKLPSSAHYKKVMQVTFVHMFTKLITLTSKVLLIAQLVWEMVLLVSFETPCTLSEFFCASLMYDDVQDVRDVLGSPQQSLQSGTWTGAAEEDPTYRLLLDCLGLVVSIDNEVASIHNYIKDKYKDKFPELASFVHDPVQYARTIQLIGNEMDLTKINLEDVLQQVSLLCFWL